MRSANFCLSSCKIIICNLIDVLIHDKESLYLGVCIGWKKVSLMNIINVFLHQYTVNIIANISRLTEFTCFMSDLIIQSRLKTSRKITIGHSFKTQWPKSGIQGKVPMEG